MAGQIENIYQFKCVKTVSVNPQDLRQTQQQQETVYGCGISLVDAIQKFEEHHKGARMDILGVGIIGQKAF